MNPHQLLKLSAQRSESGFTIIESLVAIMVAGILLAAIAPVLVISTATRVQSRRVELATDAAKAFVDAIKTKTISEAQISDSGAKLSEQPVPTAKTTLYCYHKDSKITLPSDCTNYQTTSPVQFYIQAFGNAVTAISTSTTKIDNGEGYSLGLRVYRSDVEFGSVKKTADNSGATKAAATFTGGIGDRNVPVLEMTTEIVRGQPSYSAMCDRLGGCVQ